MFLHDKKGFHLYLALALATILTFKVENNLNFTCFKKTGLIVPLLKIAVLKIDLDM